ncbi:uncharacterized protein LOC120452807 [Drosophila santomea]|uniref:uncharacterized protein LOC120452807 n=1 Tax=Drosophila santomea TaxID=129105 RepID=UPI00195387ED|nr:uncharacterized protein LOC120452807 [Drosophila santomea]
MRVDLLILLSFQLIHWTFAQVDSSHTELNHVLDRVFSRRKRFVLFPSGSNLKFTGQLSKGLISAYPKGVNMNIEQACYYPVPTKREDVYPKRYRQRTTTTVKPKTTTEPTYVWIPGTNWRFKATPLKKPMPVKLRQRIDLRPQKPSHVDPGKWAHWSKYGNRYENWSPANHNYDKYSQPGRWSKWTTPSPKWSKRWYRSADGEYYDPEVEPYEDVRSQPLYDPYDPDMAPHEVAHYPELAHLKDMRHYNGHRDRRQLFEHFDGFSKLLGIDAKACVLRAICDSKRLLLPRGYSMIQDIVRLVFTLPTTSGVEDEYSRVMQLDADDCDRQFRDSCKLNLLAWLMGGKWN